MIYWPATVHGACASAAGNRLATSKPGGGCPANRSEGTQNRSLNATVNNVGLHLKYVFVKVTRLDVRFPLLFCAERARTRSPNVFICFDNPLTPRAADSPVVGTS